jgi:hypothetical protein
MTSIAPGETVAMPLPPKGWYGERTPEIYVSVAGLDPVDAVGWRVSNTLPGTPGFAYTFGGKYSGAGTDWRLSSGSTGTRVTTPLSPRTRATASSFTWSPRMGRRPSSP